LYLNNEFYRRINFIAGFSSLSVGNIYCIGLRCEGDARMLYEAGLVAAQQTAFGAQCAPCVKEKRKFDVEQARMELEDEAECRRALAECKISPYFHSEYAPSYLEVG